tara:strand:- start:254 stop:940 length:687 start_codon:yes stop_codon:yes gene_type:complete
MSITTQFRWKRSLNGLRFLHEEHTIVNEVTSATGPEFQKYYEKFCAANGIDIAELNAKHAERVKEAYGIEKDLGQLSDEQLNIGESSIARFRGKSAEEMPTFDKEVHDTFARLFRSIATHIHPDKARDDTTRALFDQAFKEAKQALDKQQYFKLLEMAEELAIELPTNYDEQISWMETENKRLRGLIQKSTQTYNYLFYDSDSDIKRDNLIRSFLKQLFDFDVPQKNT